MSNNSMEPRVQRLLKDARASVNRPLRPETPKEFLPRGPSRRLNGAPLPFSRIDGSAECFSPVVAGTNGVLRFAVQLDAASTVEEKMTLLSVIGNELTVVRPSEEESVVTLLQRMVDMASDSLQHEEGTPLDSSALELSIRAASTVCRIALNGASPAFGPALIASVRLLQFHARNGQGSVLKRELVFDSLVQILRMQSYGWCREAILHAVGTLRHCSSEGGMLLVHLATLGLLTATHQLVTRVLPTRDADILGHCSTIFRNFSVDYAHHFVKLGMLTTIVQLLHVSCQEQWKEIVSALSRALAKLVFDDDCADALCKLEISLDSWGQGKRATTPTTPPSATLQSPPVSNATDVMVSALGQYASSRMIVARLGAATDVLLSRASEEQLATACTSHEVDWNLFLDACTKMSSSQQEATSESGNQVTDEAVQCMWRLMGTLTLCREGGRMLTPRGALAVLHWLQERDLAQSTPQQRESILLALMCLSNISFYFNTMLGEAGTAAILETLGPLLTALLFSNDTEATVEATRILGNVSMTLCGREWIEANRCDEICIVLLQHQDFRIVYNCFGVVLNLTAGDSCRIVSEPALCAQLLQQTGRFHLLDVSENPEGDEAQVSSLVEKILLNLSDLF